MQENSAILDALELEIQSIRDMADGGNERAADLLREIEKLPADQALDLLMESGLCD
jgi:hypothetical protein